VRVLVVDGANVVGSRPDGWWKDRAGAASRLLDGLARVAAEGVPVDPPGEEALPVVRRWPHLVVVLEGRARDAGNVDGLEVVRAEGAGDDEIVAQAARYADRPVTVVTADRGLRDRVEALGADVMGPGRLLELLDPLDR